MHILEICAAVASILSATIAVIELVWHIWRNLRFSKSEREQ